MKVLAVIAMTLAVAAFSEETKFGAGVTLTEATPIASIVKTPKAYVGKTVRVDGVATAVCEEMGCWMAVSESDKADAPTVRLKVEHEGAIVFPMSAKGKRVSAEGVFESIGGDDAHGQAAAAEHAAHDAKATANYQIKATGALIK